MYCRDCGQLISNDSLKCTNCGTREGLGDNYCYRCGSRIKSHSIEVCEFCGAKLNNNIDELNIKIKNKLLAGLLALFLGGMGIHRFYLGYIKIGIVQLSLWVLGYFTGDITWVIVQIWALIESILIFLGKIKDSEGNDLE
ncbi:NINE protein [Clostridium sp.]|uniref:NINE protein n=1 Tax=Clostridium sp. TaxID=1506 RepID=UPI001B74E716|nr:NINE protein [Clostridium sp.]MBP3916566.1 TM2 domain-containing protein [Clostridium sp.]MEE0931533.1 NINE protein [Clostridium sp.]